ncbi:hypothetical protein PspLS_04166 [Pyricularia sp. CBS 133598]|nr:hypothetical protein PspLS_04166 [Pyricularia sp. CBS 133598]
MATSHPKAGHTSTGNTKGRPNMKRSSVPISVSRGFGRGRNAGLLVDDGSSIF